MKLRLIDIRFGLFNVGRGIVNFFRGIGESITDFGIVIRNARGKRELILVVSIFLTVGTVGYRLIEGWPWFDALYMVIITMTTIGYGEVRDLSTEGRIFTVGLIIVGVITGTYAISTTIDTLTSDEFHRERRTLKKKRMLKQITNHTIICGYGRLGRTLVNELRERQGAVIVIDPLPEKIHMCDAAGIPAVLGNGADESVLHEAGIDRANALVATANSDAENVFIVLSARGLNPNLEIIARYNSEESVQKLKRAGAHSVISPHAIAGRRISHMLINPRITHFLDGVLRIGKEKLRLEDFEICENSPLVGKTLREASLKVNVLAVSMPGEENIAHPTADTVLQPGVELVVIGLDDDLKELERLAT